MSAAVWDNLGGDSPITLSNLIQTIGQVAGRQPIIDQKPMQPGDVPATYADISRAQSKLGFEPTTPINVGVPKFCEWYLAHPEFAEDAYNWRNSE